MGITVHSGLGREMKFYILLAFFVSANAQFPANTGYRFVPTYTGTTLSGVPTRPNTFSWRRMVVSMESKVRCLGNIRGIQDACRDFEHNDQLIRTVRCTDCRYVAEAMPISSTEEPQPRLDYTSCNCRIENGEMVEGQGPFKRDINHNVIRRNGQELRYNPEYRLVVDSDTNDEMIGVVCDPDENGNSRNHVYAACRVELTIEQCPLNGQLIRNDEGLEVYDEDTIQLDEHTQRQVRSCYTYNNGIRSGPYNPDPAPRSP